jgi:hypothetical protein
MTVNTPSSPATDQHRARGPQAAQKAAEKNSLRIDVPVIGTLTLPPAQDLAYIGGVAALTALEVIEWPVGLVLVAGHLLAANSHNKLIQDFGEALQEA